MHRLKLFFRKQIVTRCLLAQGWVLFALKRHSRAEGVLERGITLAPASYRMHFLMSRVHLAQGRTGKALQELSICYHLDPATFTRHPLDGRLRAEVELQVAAPPEADLFELSLREGGPLAGEWDDLLEGCDDGMGEEVLVGTDFRTVAEFRRFLELPPLTREDIQETDMDMLMTQLASTSSFGESFDQGA